MYATKEKARAYNRIYAIKNKEKIQIYRKLHQKESNERHPRKKYGRIYDCWGAMKSRCDNKNHPQYKDYGGRGITYTPSWKRFECFYRDMKESYVDHLTLDRIDVNGNYCKENCRWQTHKEQNNNKRKNIRIVYDGKNITLSQYAELKGLSFGTLRSRYYRGMSIDKILSEKTLRNT